MRGPRCVTTSDRKTPSLAGPGSWARILGQDRTQGRIAETGQCWRPAIGHRAQGGGVGIDAGPARRMGRHHDRGIQKRHRRLQVGFPGHRLALDQHGDAAILQHATPGAAEQGPGLPQRKDRPGRVEMAAVARLVAELPQLLACRGGHIRLKVERLQGRERGRRPEVERHGIGPDHAAFIDIEDPDRERAAPERHKVAQLQQAVVRRGGIVGRGDQEQRPFA